jgi:hypothetical protein
VAQSRNLIVSALACAAIAAPALVAPTLARADTYTLATFSGAINPGGANVKAPFSGNGFTQGDAISGHFVFDDNLVPGGGTGFQNVAQSSFPDIADIANADAFSFTMDSVMFTAGDNLTTEGPLMIQYNNGVFHGFVFTGDFQFQNVFYQLQIQGTSISVLNLDHIPNAFDPNGFPVCCSSLINAHLNGITGETPFTPTPPGGGGVPEPASWALMLLGFAGLGATLRAARARSHAAAA